MEQIALTIIEKYGIYGMIILGLAWLIFDRLQTKKQIKSTSQNINNKKENESIQKYISNIESINLSLQKIELRVSELENKFSNKNEFLNLIEQLNLSPKINNYLNDLLVNGNMNHTFFCSLHNHIDNVQGIPYYKFTCLCEKFHPLINQDDIELTTFWKDVNIFTHGQLPLLLYQESIIYFNQNNINNLDTIDDSMYRLVKRYNIKEIIFCALMDSNNNLFGFFGGYSFLTNESSIDLNQVNLIKEKITNIFINQ